MQPFISLASMVAMTILIMPEALAAPPDRDAEQIRRKAYRDALRMLQTGEIRALGANTAPQLKALPTEQAKAFRDAAQRQLPRAIATITREHHAFHVGFPSEQSFLEFYAWVGGCHLFHAVDQPRCSAFVDDFATTPHVIVDTRILRRSEPGLAPFGGVRGLISRGFTKDVRLILPPGPDGEAVSSYRRLEVTFADLLPGASPVDLDVTKDPIGIWLTSAEGVVPSEFSGEVDVLSMTLFDRDRQPLRFDPSPQAGNVRALVPTRTLAASAREYGDRHRFYWLSDTGEKFWMALRANHEDSRSVADGWKAVAAARADFPSAFTPDAARAAHAIACGKPLERSGVDGHLWLPDVLSNSLASGFLDSPARSDAARVLVGMPPLDMTGPAGKLHEWLRTTITVASSTTSHRRIVKAGDSLFDLRPDGSHDWLGLSRGARAAIAAAGSHAIVLVDNFMLTDSPAWVVLDGNGPIGTLALGGDWYDAGTVTIVDVYQHGSTPIAVLSKRRDVPEPEIVHVDLDTLEITPPRPRSRWPAELKSECPLARPEDLPSGVVAMARFATTLKKLKGPKLTLALLAANALDDWRAAHCNVDDPHALCATIAEELGAYPTLAGFLEGRPLTHRNIEALASVGKSDIATEALARMTNDVERFSFILSLHTAERAGIRRFHPYVSQIKPEELLGMVRACDRGTVFDQRRCTERRNLLQEHHKGMLIEIPMVVRQRGYDFARREMSFEVLPVSIPGGSALFMPGNMGVRLRGPYDYESERAMCNKSEVTIQSQGECHVVVGGFEVRLPVVNDAEAESLIRERPSATAVVRITDIVKSARGMPLFFPSEILGVTLRVGSHERRMLSDAGRAWLVARDQVPLLRTNDDGEIALAGHSAEVNASPLGLVHISVGRLDTLLGLVAEPDDAVAVAMDLSPTHEFLAHMFVGSAWKVSQNREKAEPEIALSNMCHNLLGPESCHITAIAAHKRSKPFEDSDGAVALDSESGIPWLVVPSNERLGKPLVKHRDSFFWWAGSVLAGKVYGWLRDGGLDASSTQYNLPADIKFVGLKGSGRRLRLEFLLSGSKIVKEFDDQTLEEVEDAPKRSRRR